jgi:hypothetical protein
MQISPVEKAVLKSPRIIEMEELKTLPRELNRSMRSSRQVR